MAKLSVHQHNRCHAVAHLATASRRWFGGVHSLFSMLESYSFGSAVTFAGTLSDPLDGMPDLGCSFRCGPSAVHLHIGDDLLLMVPRSALFRTSWLSSWRCGPSTAGRLVDGGCYGRWHFGLFHRRPHSRWWRLPSAAPGCPGLFDAPLVSCEALVAD